MPASDGPLAEYAAAHTTPETEHLAGVARKTRARPDAGMLSGLVEGRLLETLVFATGAERVLELGTYTGYSALSMAAALPAGGRVITCEADADNAREAQANFDASPIGERIELRQGPALATVEALPGPFDLVFVDAEKTGYRGYFEALLPKLGPRGLMLFDNTLWSGRVLDPDTDDERTAAITSLNEALLRDARVVVVQLTVRDGISLVRRADTRAP